MSFLFFVALQVDAGMTTDAVTSTIRVTVGAPSTTRTSDTSVSVSTAATVASHVDTSDYSTPDTAVSTTVTSTSAGVSSVSASATITVDDRASASTPSDSARVADPAIGGTTPPHPTTEDDYDGALVVWATVGVTVTLGGVLLLVVVGLACLGRRVRRRRRRASDVERGGYRPIPPLSTPQNPPPFSLDDSTPQNPDDSEEIELFDVSEAGLRRARKEADDI